MLKYKLYILFFTIIVPLEIFSNCPDYPNISLDSSGFPVATDSAGVTWSNNGVVFLGIVVKSFQGASGRKVERKDKSEIIQGISCQYSLEFDRPLLLIPSTPSYQGLLPEPAKRGSWALKEGEYRCSNSDPKQCPFDKM
jgi:hypothetical protein